MDIIEYGQLPQERRYRKRCGYCKTLFEFKESEATPHHGRYNERHVAVDCPYCQQRTYADKSNLV